MKIPDLFGAKIVRVDKNRNQILIWFGGQYIKAYSLQTGQEADIMTVEEPVRAGWISYSQVKNKMREHINK